MLVLLVPTADVPNRIETPNSLELAVSSMNLSPDQVMSPIAKEIISFVSRIDAIENKLRRCVLTTCINNQLVLVVVYCSLNAIEFVFTARSWMYLKGFE